MKNKKLLTRIGLFACSLLCASTALAGPYVDKHGNSSNLFLGPPLVGYSFNAGIDITVQYVANDSNGGATGKYRITSQYLPGRGPTDDFVLNVMVTNDATQRGAELVIRNNADVAPIAPIVRLLDCSTTPCSEDKRLENEIWGAFVIQDQDDVASYPIELLDARAISQFLDPSFLAQLPNNGDGSGNWKEILENHRLNFQESKFRMDIDHLGEAQSDLLTRRMIAEFPIADASGKDWVRKHAEDIQHGALSFLTEHKDLIEDLSEVLVD